MIDLEQINKDGKNALSVADLKVLYETAKDSKIMIEIGSRDGCSTILLGLIAQQNKGHVLCIERKPVPSWTENMKKYGLENNVHLYFGESPWTTLPFASAGVDYLFIDGCHETENVIADFHFYKRYLKPGGRVGFHDWGLGTEGTTPKVRKAIEIILINNKLREIARQTNISGLIVFEKL